VYFWNAAEPDIPVLQFLLPLSATNKNGDPKAAVLISNYLWFELIEICALNFIGNIAQIENT